MGLDDFKYTNYFGQTQNNKNANIENLMFLVVDNVAYCNNHCKQNNNICTRTDILEALNSYNIRVFIITATDDDQYQLPCFVHNSDVFKVNKFDAAVFRRVEQRINSVLCRALTPSSSSSSSSSSNSKISSSSGISYSLSEGHTHSLSPSSRPDGIPLIADGILMSMSTNKLFQSNNHLSVHSATKSATNIKNASYIGDDVDQDQDQEEEKNNNNDDDDDGIQEMQLRPYYVGSAIKSGSISSSSSSPSVQSRKYSNVENKHNVHDTFTDKDYGDDNNKSGHLPAFTSITVLSASISKSESKSKPISTSKQTIIYTKKSKKTKSKSKSKKSKKSKHKKKTKTKKITISQHNGNETKYSHTISTSNHYKHLEQQMMNQVNHTQHIQQHNNNNNNNDNHYNHDNDDNDNHNTKKKKKKYRIKNLLW